MKNNIGKRGSLVLGPNGNVLTIADLPTSARIRWVPRRKAEVVSAVAGGLLTISEACTRYAVSLEEFAQWRKDWESGGLKYLQVSRPKMSEVAAQ
jgi:transposase-like protein